MKLLGENGHFKGIKLNQRLSDYCGRLAFKWDKSLNQLEIKSYRKLNIFTVAVFSHDLLSI